MTERIWILGPSSDPEMEAIEGLLREAGERIIYALDERGERVTPATAYRAYCSDFVLDRIRSRGGSIYLVECDLADARFGTHSPEYTDCAAVVERIDHHRPGDPGYGRPPSEFLPASSIGQVIAELARLGRLPPAPRQVGGISSSIMDDGWDRGLPSWVPWQRGQLSAGTPGQWVLRGYRGLWAVAEAAEYPGHRRAVYVPTDIILAAAADHCLAAAYRGECPGVDPDALMRWRAESRARFQRRPVEAVLADVERARLALRRAPTLQLDEAEMGPARRRREGGEPEETICAAQARDLRGQHVPELPEAAAREGECFIAALQDRGRIKVVCQSGTPSQIEAFMRVWAPANGLTDIYGDPARGFAGGYAGVQSQLDR